MSETRPSLIMRICNNDPAGWSEFVDMYRPCLVGYARQKGASPEEAEDVAQQVLMNLMKTLPKFEYDPSRGRFRSYLYRSTCNALIEWWRQNRRHTENRSSWTSWLEEIAEHTNSAEVEVDRQWVEHLQQQVLQQAFASVQSQVQPDTWGCFELHILNRIPAADVANRLGKQTNAVYVNACRVLQRVREKCQELMEPLDEFT